MKNMNGIRYTKEATENKDEWGTKDESEEDTGKSIKNTLQYAKRHLSG